MENSKEAILVLLKYLKGYYELSAVDAKVKIDDLDTNLRRYVVSLLLEKFSKDYKIIDILETTKYTYTDPYGNESIHDIYTIQFTDEFGNFYDEYLASNGSQDKKENSPKKVDASIVYWISYSEKGRKIILNDAFLIANPDFDSSNENFFTYLFKNPNRAIPLNEFEEKGGVNMKRGFHRMLGDLNFQGKLREAFFDVSKNAITFHNPITKDDMHKRNMDLLKLSEIVRDNPTKTN